MSLSLFSQRGHGAVTLSFSQVGADTIVSWSGDLTVTGLSSNGGTFGTLQLNNTATQDEVIKTQPGDNAYQFLTPTVNLFAGTPTGIVFSSQIAPAVTDRFGFKTFGSGFEIMVPSGFTTGTVSGGLGVSNYDLANLGVQTGTYSWGPADNQMLIVTLVPEPTTFLLGLTGLLTWIVRRRR